MSFDPTQVSSCAQLIDAIAQRSVCATEVTQAYLQRIEALNPSLNVYTQVLADQALQRAQQVDAGKLTGPLAGLPIAVKDNICTTDGATTCSSRMLADFHAPYNATVVNRLLEAGAVILGKTNLDEFAMGSSTENSYFKTTRNPWDTQRVPGGSSGGSAAAVAADLCAAALGSDTGGSIRQPASFCGVLGFKPTYGTVSRFGLVAFASSLDQIGPMTRNADDARLIMSVIAGHDPADETSMPDDMIGAWDKPAELKDLAGLKIGLPSQYLSDANDPAMTQAIDNAVAQFTELGAVCQSVELPHTEYGIPTYYLIATAEAGSNLARYDGVHYGHRTEQADDLVDLYAQSRAEGFGDEVKRRIMLGTFALSSGYYDAYYNKALKVRRLIRNDFDKAFEQIDVICCPTTTGPAFAIGEKTDDPLQMYLADIYTVNCNLAGIPGLSLPCGMAEVQGRTMPMGMQLLGPLHGDQRLLQIAEQWQQHSQWHLQRPAL